MSIIQLLLVGGGLMALMIVGYVVMSGKSPAKESQRRLQGIRYRHSESTVDKVESQLKKAIAARKPKFHKMAGSTSRVEALSVRLDRTGKGWTLSQYMYASLGIAPNAGVEVERRPVHVTKDGKGQVVQQLLA